MVRQLATLLLFFPGVLTAQAVELRLREDPAGVPIAGAIVRLIGEQGVVAQGLTSEVGRLTLRAPAAGGYRLKIDRIGFAGMLTGRLVLDSTVTLRLEVPMVSRRTELPTLTVRGRSECGAESKGGSLAAVLWEEIRKALIANVITQRASAVPIHLREFIRELDTDGRTLREWVVRSTLIRGQPFGALPPAHLARVGFVNFLNESTDFAAPDAALLLSDEFVATHCFRPVRGPGPLVGLAFEPVPGRRVVEVQGALWVDRASSELRFLEYSYVGLTGMLKQAGVGGRVEFQRLSSGPWIISYWHIRTPRLVTAEVRGLDNMSRKIERMTGYDDRGGRAAIAADALGRVDRAVIVGQVYDSVAGAGLTRAFVGVRGTTDSVLTDGEGLFELAVEASGDQVVTASHPKLGLVRGSTSQPVLLSLGDTTVVRFAVPPLTAFVRELCGVGRRRSGVVGLAWGADGKPAANLEAVVKWRTSSGGERSERARINSKGLYALCDLPPDRTLPLWLEDRSYNLLEKHVRLDLAEYRWLDLRAWGSADTTLAPRFPKP